MDYMLLRASRTTHLKIVAVALVAATSVVLVGINARMSNTATAPGSPDSIVVKAGSPATYADQRGLTIR